MYTNRLNICRWKNNGALLKTYSYDDNNKSTSTMPGAKNVLLPYPVLFRRPWATAMDTEPPTGNNERRRLEQNQTRQLGGIPTPAEPIDSRDLFEADHVIFFGDDNLLAMGHAAAGMMGNESPLLTIGNHLTNFSFGNLSKITYMLDKLHGNILHSTDTRTISLTLVSICFIPRTNVSKRLLQRSKMDTALPLSLDQVDLLTACEALIRRVWYRKSLPMFACTGGSPFLFLGTVSPCRVTLRRNLVTRLAPSRCNT